MRYFIKFAYCGTEYHGWQIQPNATTIQEVLNNSVSLLLSSNIHLTGAGRTDTGVHAKMMYAHFDFEGEFDTKKLTHQLNAYLPKDIVLYDIILVHDDAHARFDAIKRTYQYHIHQYKDPFLYQKSWYFYQKLDVDLMNQAANSLLNHTDFQCFSKLNTEVTTYNCNIYEAYWKMVENKLVFTISANRFLRNMVRAIVGTLINIGTYKITLQDFEAIIQSKDRNKAGVSVPAHGLYLTEVAYDYLQK